jgi:hypothetical protein
VRIAAGWLLCCCLVGSISPAAQAQQPRLKWQDNQARISAPQLHFLSGAALQRLKNGAAVPFDFQLTVWVDDHTTPYGRAIQRIIVSYDLWEEKFALANQRGFLVRGGGSRLSEFRQGASNLSAQDAEAWCMNAIGVPLSGLSGNQRVWARLDVRAADGKDAPPLLGESGLSLTGLIELFSRPARGSEQRWSAEAGPTSVADLQRSSGRGS